MNKTLGLAVFAAFVLGGCLIWKRQDAILLLYEKQITSGLTAVPNANYTGNVSIGPLGKTVPIQITWSAGQDDEGCLRIVKLKVERTGGDPSLIISNWRHSVSSCVTMAESGTTRFEFATVSLHYETIKGIKEYVFDGPVATIQGNGVFRANDRAVLP